VEERGRREVGDDPDRWATVVSGWERGSWAGVWEMGWRMVGPNLAERHDGLKKKRKRKEGSWGLVREIERKRGSEGWFWDFELLFENYNTHSNKTNAKSCMHSNT
jgi:hypothetical protein